MRHVFFSAFMRHSFPFGSFYCWCPGFKCLHHSFYVFSWSLGFTTRTTSSFVRFLVLVSYDPPVQTVAVGFPENKN